MCSGEGWRCVPLLVVPKALGDLFRHAAPQLAVVALHPRVGAQRLEQRDQRAARAVLVVSHGGRRKKKSVFSPALFPIAISRAPRGRTRRSTRYARDRSPRRGSAVRAGSVADRDRPTTLRRRCTAECGGGGRARRRRFLEAFAANVLKALPNQPCQLLQTKFWELSKEGESYDTRFSSLREHFAARGGGKPGADRG